MTGPEDAVQRARDAYARRDWTTARELFRSARSDDPADWYAAASCSWWLGDLETALPMMERAYRALRAAGAVRDSAMVALDLGYTLLLRGDEAPGSGWLARARADAAEDPGGPQHGYLAHVDFEAAFGAGDLDGAEAAIDRLRTVAVAHRDSTLDALALVGQGRVLLRRARVDEGVALLDQAMVAALTEVDDPGWAGNVYCHLMSACIEVSDLRRAAEWTEQTARWCESMPGAGPFLGICRVHRAQILHLRGGWDEADREIGVVCDEVSSFDVPVVAEAHCLRGDLRRLRGDLAGSAEEYAAARAMGRDPMPGVAMLALARGDAGAAVASLRAGLAELPADDMAGRARLLPSLVEAALAHGNVPGAESAATELEQVAGAFGTVGSRCAAATARGRVLLARGRPLEAQDALQDAVHCWSVLDAPYELARTLQLSADAHDALGDPARARLDRQAARDRLQGLGGGLDAPGPAGPSALPTGDDALTARESEVLTLVAEGRSNRDVADLLVISVRTVERHLDSVYRKLGVSGRSARVAAVRSLGPRAGADGARADGMGGPLGDGTDPRRRRRS